MQLAATEITQARECACFDVMHVAAAADMFVTLRAAQG